MTERLDEVDNWVRHTGLSRRAALGGGVAAAGYALAARPVSAGVIATSAEGLVAGMERFPASGGFAMRAYEARPVGDAARPVILVVQEIFGLHEWIQDIARRLAHAGYHAIAPDLFERQGDPTTAPDIATLSREIVQKVPDAQVMADLDAAAAWAGTRGAAADRLGVTGFCWGGRISWLYAAHQPRLRAGVAWYGRLTGEARPLQPRHPIDVAGALLAPVLGLYGDRDRGIPVADVEAMRAALEAAGSPGRIVRYPDADHGFLADYRPSYHEDSARKAWAEALGWFSARLLRPDAGAGL